MTLLRTLLIVGLSLALCRCVYAYDALWTWIDGDSVVAPLGHLFGSIGPEDDENILLAVVLIGCSSISTFVVTGANTWLSKGR